jgi:hypothetical protein
VTTGVCQGIILRKKAEFGAFHGLSLATKKSTKLSLAIKKGTYYIRPYLAFKKVAIHNFWGVDFAGFLIVDLFRPKTLYNF